MSELNFKTLKQPLDSDNQFVWWPSLLDIVLTLVQILILLITLLLIKDSRTYRYLIIEENETIIASAVTRAFGNLEAKESIDISKDGTVQNIRIPDKLLFDSGSYELNAQGQQLITEIGRIIARYDHLLTRVELVGYADPTPVRGRTLYRDNLDLSCLRAASAVKEIINLNIIDQQKLSAVGRSYFESGNIGTGEFSKLRRVEVRLIYKEPE